MNDLSMRGFDNQINQRLDRIEKRIFVELNQIERDVGALKRQGNTGSLSVMGTADDILDLKIVASEARSETKMAKLEGKIDLMASAVQNLTVSVNQQRSETKSLQLWTIATIIASALAMIALILSVMSFGASTFYNGTVVRDLIHNEIVQEGQKK